MTSNIKNLEDLQAERARLKADLEICKGQLKADFHLMEERLKPANIMSDILKHVIKPYNTGGILGDSLTSGIGSIANKLVLHNLPFPIRMVASYFLKNWTGNYLQEKGPDMIEMVKLWWSTFKSKNKNALAETE